MYVYIYTIIRKDKIKLTKLKYIFISILFILVLKKFRFIVVEIKNRVQIRKTWNVNNIFFFFRRKYNLIIEIEIKAVVRNL